MDGWMDGWMDIYICMDDLISCIGERADVCFVSKNACIG